MRLTHSLTGNPRRVETQPQFLECQRELLPFVPGAARQIARLRASRLAWIIAALCGWLVAGLVIWMQVD